ncbi:uncharacterized protein K02A2.6-like [Anopheles albimanus]|uniref:uncharacterized protein K02A2.6-like n=1 Tax=Anopheles albimanus TaxID=7167 RepID=UPI001641F494|nr:uncharacterized protein K02A2.6-like [Anopheles albimanus]
MDTMLAGLEDVAVYLDDIVIGGVDESTHVKNLTAILKKLQDYGFKIRREKCTFGQSPIKYLGHILDKNGVRPDPAKIEAITKMPQPKNQSEVRSFLGAINYYGKFVPHMRNLRYPLDELLKKDGPWHWSVKCQEAFDAFKQILQSELLLTHYDPTKPIIVAADASSVGLGATISHRMPDGSLKVVQHAARALTKTESNYSQPDREGLAVIYAVKKFHRLIYGRKFLLLTDHAPLIRIFGSRTGIPVYTANRLQRWALTLLLYDFQIEYVPTDKFGNADILSRLIAEHEQPEDDYVIASINVDCDICYVVNEATKALPLKFTDVTQETCNDSVLQKAMNFTQKGWPKKKITESELKQLQARSESLSIFDGCLLFGERIVIPKSQRERCLQMLHKGHPGIGRMKALARSYIYWPGIDHDIENKVRSCRSCMEVAKTPSHCDPAPWPESTTPWQRVHVDFAGPIDGCFFLLVIDACSKWPEIVPTVKITSEATIRLLRSIFARFGFPSALVSDNGTQFTSVEFTNFCTSNGIQHIRTAPFHPQSNGQAERFVDTFKRALKKIKGERMAMQEALDIFLLTYRSTPSKVLEDGRTPAEVMIGRKLRTCLEILKTPPKSPCNASHTYSRMFKIGDPVYAKKYRYNSWKWIPGVVIKRIGSVMYLLGNEHGEKWRSHVNQLRKRSLGDDITVTADRNSRIATDILLDAWELRNDAREPLSTATLSQPSSGSPASPPSSSPESSSSSPSNPDEPPVLVSPDSATASSGSPTPVQHPRRSSRVRRPPRWMQAYQQK